MQRGDFQKKGVEGVKRECEVRCEKGERREVVQRGGAQEKCREIAFSVVLLEELQIQCSVFNKGSW